MKLSFTLLALALAANAYAQNEKIQTESKQSPNASIVSTEQADILIIEQKPPSKNSLTWFPYKQVTIGAAKQEDGISKLSANGIAINARSMLFNFYHSNENTNHRVIEAQIDFDVYGSNLADGGQSINLRRLEVIAYQMMQKNSWFRAQWDTLDVVYEKLSKNTSYRTTEFIGGDMWWEPTKQTAPVRIVLHGHVSIMGPLEIEHSNGPEGFIEQMMAASSGSDPSNTTGGFGMGLGFNTSTNISFRNKVFTNLKYSHNYVGENRYQAGPHEHSDDLQLKTKSAEVIVPLKNKWFRGSNLDLVANFRESNIDLKHAEIANGAYDPARKAYSVRYPYTSFNIDSGKNRSAFVGVRLSLGRGFFYNDLNR